jgi:hypothetical protein
MNIVPLMCTMLAVAFVIGTLIWAILHGIPALFNLFVLIVTGVLVGIIRVVISCRAALHEDASHPR